MSQNRSRTLTTLSATSKAPEGPNEVQVSIMYKKGGRSLYQSDDLTPGYYLILRPQSYNPATGMVTTGKFAVRSFLLVPASRFNANRLASIRVPSDSLESELSLLSAEQDIEVDASTFLSAA